MSPILERIPPEIRLLSNREAVERYVAGADVPSRAITGLSPAQLQAFPVPGTWSIQQIVLHLMDSDFTASYRMKRTIAEDRPHLDAYDESAFAARLGYNQLDPFEACKLFRGNRLLMGAILRNLSENAFDRVALHPENGEMTLGLFVRLYVWHLDHHMRFLCVKRQMVGACRENG